MVGGKSTVPFPKQPPKPATWGFESQQFSQKI